MTEAIRIERTPEAKPDKDLPKEGTGRGISTGIRNALSRLADKYCDSYRHDAALDAEWIDKCLKEMDAETNDFYYVICFRDCGTDHPSFVACKNMVLWKDDEREEYFNELYRLMTVFEAHRCGIGGGWRQTLRKVNGTGLQKFMWEHFGELMRKYGMNNTSIYASHKWSMPRESN